MENRKWKRRFDLSPMAVLTAMLCFLSPASLRAQTAAKQPAGFDLLVKNGAIVTMDGERRILEDGVVAVSGDAISFVGKQSDFLLSYQRTR